MRHIEFELHLHAHLQIASANACGHATEHDEALVAELDSGERVGLVRISSNIGRGRRIAILGVAPDATVA